MKRAFTLRSLFVIGLLISLSINQSIAQEEFMKAASIGDTAKVRSLLEQKKAKIKYKDKNGETAIMKAADKGHLHMVEFLAERKAEIDAKDKNGTTALMIASFNDDTAIVSYILKNKIKINNSDNEGNTALTMAADTGNLEVVKMLVEKGAELNSMNKIHTNAILRASENGYTEIVKYLAEKGADLDVQDMDGFTPLMFAVTNEDYAMMKSLVEKGANLQLTDKGKYRFTALVYSAETGEIEIVKYLLEKVEADKNADTAFISFQKGQALLIAAKQKYPDIMQTLLSHGADVNSSNRDGFTSLMYATIDGSIEIVKLLLMNNADPNIKHFFQSKTALNWAKEKKFAEIERMLLRVGGKEAWEVH